MFLTTIKKNYKQVFRTLYYVRNCSNIKARESVNSLCKHEIPILRRLFQVVNAAGRKQMGIIQKKPGFHDTNIWDTGYIKKNTVRTSQKTNGLHISKSHKLTRLLCVVKFPAVGAIKVYIDRSNEQIIRLVNLWLHVICMHSSYYIIFLKGEIYAECTLK